jgi:hypothetical protein
MLIKASSRLDSSVWKERVEGLETVEKAMNSAMNITPNLGSDFQASMKVSKERWDSLVLGTVRCSTSQCTLHCEVH